MQKNEIRPVSCTILTPDGSRPKCETIDTETAREDRGGILMIQVSERVF